jgi:hypothetical protein
MMKYASVALLVAPVSAIVGKYCKIDSDCTNGGYCMNDDTKQPRGVFLCHGGASDDYCQGDGDCTPSYCDDDPTKNPVAQMYLCHAGEKAATSKQVETQTCEIDTDCTSYCEDDPTKTPPYYCHAIGGTCGKDDDCVGYCENDPTKTPPFYCHMPNPHLKQNTFLAY